MVPADLIEKQKKTLIDEKERLEKKTDELKKFPNYGQNEDDNAKEVSDFENNLSIEEQLNYLLNKVKRALESIEDGNYGKCKKCSKTIEQGRLEIIPYAELCIGCRKSENGR